MPPNDRQEKLKSAFQFLTYDEFRAGFAKATDLIRAAIKDLNAKVDARLAQVKDGAQGPKGDKGDSIVGPRGPKGEKGDKGDAGEAGFDADEQAIAARVKAELLPEVVAEVEKQLPALGLAIHDSLKLLPEADRPNISLFAGLEEYVKAFVTKYTAGFGPGGGTSFSLMQSGTLKVQQPLSLNFKGAGAPTITNGQNGVVHLDFPSGGTSNTSVYEEVPADSGDHLSFTIAHTPVTGTFRLYRGGARQQLTADYTRSGATITLLQALQTGETLLADYQY